MNLLKKVKHTLSNGTDRRSQQNSPLNGKFIAEDKFSLLLNSIPSVVTYVDKNHSLQYVNDAFEKMFGIDRDKVIGKPIAEFLGKEAYHSIKDYMETALSGKQVHYEMEVPLKDGSRYIDANYTPDFDKDGNVIGSIGLINDVSEKKQIEKELKRKQLGLQESEKSYRTLIENIPAALYTCDAEGYITLYNKAAAEIWGREPEIGKDKWCGWWKIYQADGITPMTPDSCPMAITIKEGRAVTDKEIVIERPDGKKRNVRPSPVLVFDKNGKITGAINMLLDVTEGKQAEQLIRENEERLRMAVQSTKLGTWEFFPLTGTLNWSEECKKIYDAPGDLEVNYDFFSKHIHPDDADFAQQAILKAMDPVSGGEYDIQYRILRYSDKQPRWIRAQGKVYFNSNKEAERFIGTVLDITEQKTHEQELKNSVELFTTMADNVPAMIWMSGDDKFCDFFNKTWLEFTGRTIKEESNEGWLENVHPDDVQKCIDDYYKSFNDQKGFYTEYRLKRHDGQYRWIADNSVPRYNTDGSFAGFISACIDIDDQKNFREKIMESELRFKTISNASPVGLWMTDANGQNTFVNDTWIEWTGIPFEKQLGMGWLDRLLEDDKVNAPSNFIATMIKREKFTSEFRLKRADGEIRWCLTEGFPYYDIDGKFLGYAGSVTDITGMKKIEERKDDFIKMASHELKTPITSIKGYVQLLLNIYDELNEEKFQASRPTVKSSLNTISKQVSKLTRLVSELLDLTRIESGKLELRKTEFSLGGLLEEAVQEVRHTTSRHAIILHNDFEGIIYADKDRISQVLLNLLTNAIKYSSNSNKIEVFAEGNKQIITIRVKDYGIGIDKKDHDNIFQRFYRVEGKSEQTYPGFGIGLFIAGEIIQRHDGTIFVESETGEGSVFTITLPLGLPRTN